jgi:hypothetical protein
MSLSFSTLLKKKLDYVQPVIDNIADLKGFGFDFVKT